MCVIFAISAPLGMAGGVAIITAGSVNPGGVTYLLVQGVFDSICAGILLYLGYALVMFDFPEDVRTHCKEEDSEAVTSGPKAATTGTRVPWRRYAMYLALWMGAGAMAVVGMYL